MTIFKQIQTQFKGISGTIDLFIDGLQFNFIDIDKNEFECSESFSLSCGCCHDFQTIEKEISFELEFMEESDIADLIEQLNKLKSQQ